MEAGDSRVQNQTEMPKNTSLGDQNSDHIRNLIVALVRVKSYVPLEEQEIQVPDRSHEQRSAIHQENSSQKKDDQLFSRSMDFVPLISVTKTDSSVSVPVNIKVAELKQDRQQYLISRTEILPSTLEENNAEICTLKPSLLLSKRNILLERRAKPTADKISQDFPRKKAFSQQDNSLKAEDTKPSFPTLGSQTLTVITNGMTSASDHQGCPKKTKPFTQNWGRISVPSVKKEKTCASEQLDNFQIKNVKLPARTSGLVSTSSATKGMVSTLNQQNSYLQSSNTELSVSPMIKEESNVILPKNIPKQVQDLQTELEPSPSTLQGNSVEGILPQRLTLPIPSERVVPEGGFGWIVVLASFWTNGCTFGLSNTFGTIYEELVSKKLHSGINPGSASLVGSLCAGSRYFMSLPCGLLIHRIGLQYTTFIGCFLIVCSLFVSSFTKSIYTLWITYGVMLGTGFGFMYTPSIVILGDYFSSRLGIVNGLVGCGSSIFTVIISIGMRPLLNACGFHLTMKILSVIYSSLFLCCFIFRPRLYKREGQGTDLILLANRSPRSLWSNRGYIIWVSSMIITFIGYLVPVIHIVHHVVDVLPGSNGEVLVALRGGVSLVGRLICGRLSDSPYLSPLLVQALCFMGTGLLTIVIPLYNNYYYLLIVYILLGLLDGGFLTLVGPVAVLLVGSEMTPQAVGFALGLCSVAALGGPYIVGSLYEHLNNYFAGFIFAGISNVVAGFIIFFIPRQKNVEVPPNSVAYKSF